MHHDDGDSWHASAAQPVRPESRIQMMLMTWKQRLPSSSEAEYMELIALIRIAADCR
jgi:hypothetical protein